MPRFGPGLILWRLVADPGQHLLGAGFRLLVVIRPDGQAAYDYGGFVIGRGLSFGLELNPSQIALLLD